MILDKEKTMLEYRYDTQLLIEGTDLDEDVINDYFTQNFKGDCLLAVGDELVKLLLVGGIFKTLVGKALA